jgi:hypothetical protein
MSKADFDTTLQRYVDAATTHGKATLVGDNKTANKQASLLKKIYKRLEEDNSLAEDLIKSLFQQDNVPVKIWASAHALGLNIHTDEAVRILDQYSKNKSIGILGLTSEMTVKEWRKKGSLKF